MIDPYRLGSIERNARLLKEDWLAEISKGLNRVIGIVKDELRLQLPGILNVLLDPFIEMGAMTYLRGLRKTAEAQADVVIQCAKNALINQDFEASVEKYGRQYVEHDEMYVHCKKHHPAFPRIKASILHEFELRVKDAATLLGASPPDQSVPFTSAAEIYRTAYPSVDEARALQEQEMACVQERLELVKSAGDLIDIPFGMAPILFRIIERGTSYTQQEYVANLDRYFDV